MLLALIPGALMLGGALTAPAGAVQGGVRPEGIQRAIERVYPALVRIHVVAVDYNQGREVKTEAAGSGAIISAEGHVITNHHVAGRARRIQCTLSDREEVTATLVGTDPLTDIAVIKLDLSGRDASRPLHVAAFGDSDRLKVGDPVLAMGSPRAISQSVTMGIVSNTEMTWPSLLWPATFKLDGEETGTLVKWIAHDAPIFPGNSGGPLVNLEGEIVGINEISFGLGGAIPGNLARGVAEEIIRQGRPRRSWLGLELQPRLKATSRGALVSGVVAGSPAQRAGLRAGDVLLAYAGQPVDVRYSEELPELNRRLLGTPVGSRVPLVYLREGREQTVSAVTVARGAAEGDEAEATDWGLTVTDLTLLSAKELQREERSGVLVGSVRAGGPGAEAKPALQPRDIIVTVAGTPVHTVKELLDTTNALTAGRKDLVPALVAFERRSQHMLTVVKLGGRPAADRSAAATKAWLPATTQVLTADVAAALGLEGSKGVYVTEVYPGGSAEAAGLKVGDIVLKIDGEPIAASQPEDVEVFPAMIRQYPIGARVTLDVVRAGQPLQLPVQLAPSPRSTRELAEYRDVSFDFSARDLTFQDRIEARLGADQRGALITSVEEGGWAALAHLAVGDVVMAVDGEPIATAAELETRMQRIAEKRPAAVVFLVRRGIHTLFLELEPAWSAAKREMR